MVLVGVCELVSFNWPFPRSTVSPIWSAIDEAEATRAAQMLALAGSGRSDGSLATSAVSAPAPAGLKEIGEAPPQPGTSTPTAPAAGRPAAEETPSASLEATNGGAASGNAVGTAPAAPGDALARWFEPSVSARLGRAGCKTLGDVVAGAESGRIWWSMAPGIGPKKAAQIAQRARSLLPNASELKGEKPRAGDPGDSPVVNDSVLPERPVGSRRHSLPPAAGILGLLNWPPSEVNNSETVMSDDKSKVGGHEAHLKQGKKS